MQPVNATSLPPHHQKNLIPAGGKGFPLKIWWGGTIIIIVNIGWSAEGLTHNKRELPTKTAPPTRDRRRAPPCDWFWFGISWSVCRGLRLWYAAFAAFVSRGLKVDSARGRKNAAWDIRRPRARAPNKPAMRVWLPFNNPTETIKGRPPNSLNRA